MNCFFAILLIVLIYRCLPSGFLPSYFRAFRVFRGSLFPSWFLPSYFRAFRVFRGSLFERLSPQGKTNLKGWMGELVCRDLGLVLERKPDVI